MKKRETRDDDFEEGKKKGGEITMMTIDERQMDR